MVKIDITVVGEEVGEVAKMVKVAGVSKGGEPMIEVMEGKCGRSVCQRKCDIGQQ